MQLRVSADTQRSLVHAARLRGVPLSDFIVNSANDAATRTIEEHSVIRLSARDSEAFAMALLNPSTLNNALQSAKERYKWQPSGLVRCAHE